MKFSVAVALVALLATPVLAGPVYKWVDARGVVHFGDNPPHGAGVNAETMPPPPPPVARPPQEPEAAPADAASAQEAGEHGEGPAHVAIVDHDEKPVGREVRAYRGKVKNQGGSDAHDVYVAIVVTEPTQGDECLRDEIDVQPSTLAPGEVGTFEARFDNPCFNGPVDVDMRAAWR